MKNTFMLAAALAGTFASASNGLGKIVTDNLMNYAGLSATND